MDSVNRGRIRDEQLNFGVHVANLTYSAMPSKDPQPFPSGLCIFFPSFPTPDMDEAVLAGKCEDGRERSRVVGPSRDEDTLDRLPLVDTTVDDGVNLE